MPPGWPAARQRIMIRDGFACQICGGPAAVVDHIRRGIEDDSNLRALCLRHSVAKTVAEALDARGIPR
jgi:5-methylcytosine-specific restriction endonuclease McrA